MLKCPPIKSHLMSAAEFTQRYGYLEVFERSGLGHGVRSRCPIIKGEVICEFRGRLFTMDQMKRRSNPANDKYLQVTGNLYLGPTRTADCFFNHSCDPNAGCIIEDGHVLCVAISTIPAGEEITYDYSTMSAEDFWEMDCLCGSPLCRKKVGDFKDMPWHMQQKYIDLGIVPDFVIASLRVEHSSKGCLSRAA